MKIKDDDSQLRWEIIESEISYEARIFKLRSVRKHAPNGKNASFVSMDAPDWVTIIPELKSGVDAEFLMVRQYRHGSETIEVEFPAGVVDPGEKPLEAAARELLEETGYRAAELREIGSVNPNPAFMSNRTYTYLARGLEKIAELKLDEHELLDVHKVSYRDLHESIGHEPCANAITTQAWYFYLRDSGRI